MEYMLLVCWGTKIEKDKLKTFDVWLLETWIELQKAGKGELIIEIAFICWQIWKMRNEVVIGRKAIELDMVVYRIRKAIGEYY